MASKNLTQVIKEAILDYATFDSEEVQDAVIEGLTSLDTDLNEAGYEQSSRAELAVQKIEEAMNVADGTRQEKGEGSDS